MSIHHPLLKLLSDTDYHSGSHLADKLQVSRAAVWKSVKAMQKLGIAIQGKHGKGYRLLQQLDLLDEQQLKQHLNTPQPQLELHTELPSTNLYLLERMQHEPIHARVVLCEYQSQGRGRRGRDWVSPFAAGLYLSIGWHFAAPPASLNALSLASGVALIQALQQLGVKPALKWPNDIIADDAKLAGILIESRSETATSCDVIIGIGLNVRLDSRYRRGIDQAVIDLASLTPKQVTRNQLAAAIINQQFSMLHEVASHGPASFIDTWRKFDYLSGKQAALDTGGKTLHGLVKGVDDNGLLLMSIDGVEQRFSSGEVSLRAAS
ncbi:MAG: biotin--[acetyl-CoA-carboxylase] ligase [Gammaproteobacteria bacterium]